MTAHYDPNPIRRWIHRAPDRLRDWLIGDNQGGMPNNQIGQRIEPMHDWAGDLSIDHYYICFRNDAGEIWIARQFEGETNSDWVMYMTAQSFRRMALWYLWRWAWHEWFGLRRKIYYWDLHRRVQKYKLS